MKKNYVTLGELATYVNGYAFKPTDWSDEGLEIIRIQNLTGNLSEVNLYSGEYNKKYEVNNGDVLISWSASLGVYVWNKGRAILNQHIFKVVFNKVDVDKEFFIQQVGYILGRANVHAHGATMKHLTRPVFDSLKFYFPSREEQKDISNKLCIVDRLIELHEKYVKDLEQLVKSRFIEMFGDLKLNDKKWEVKFFKDLTLLITDGEHSTPRRTDNGIYLLSARNVLNHSLQLNDIDYIDEVEYERISKRIQPMIGDVLLSCSGSVGRCCAITKDIKFQMVRSVALLRFKAEINPVFAEYMIVSDYLQEQINSNKTASSQSNLFQGKIKMLKGVIPPLDLQNQFADFVEEVNKSKLEVQKSLEELETLKKSLMQQYFG